MTARLDGKVALITGSGRGIGCAIALKLAGEGARIVVNDLDQEPAQEAAQAIRAPGGQAVACPGSVGQANHSTAKAGIVGPMLICTGGLTGV